MIAEAVLNYAETISDLAKDEPDLAQTLAAFRSLESVIQWMKEEGIPFHQMDLVTQDEFSHDVLILQGRQPVVVVRRNLIWGSDGGRRLEPLPVGR